MLSFILVLCGVLVFTRIFINNFNIKNKDTIAIILSLFLTIFLTLIQWLINCIINLIL
jgi:CBS domain containing-hemolysin-like protein